MIKPLVPRVVSDAVKPLQGRLEGRTAANGRPWLQESPVASMIAIVQGDR